MTGTHQESRLMHSKGHLITQIAAVELDVSKATKNMMWLGRYEKNKIVVHLSNQLIQGVTSSHINTTVVIFRGRDIKLAIQTLSRYIIVTSTSLTTPSSLKSYIKQHCIIKIRTVHLCHRP